MNFRIFASVFIGAICAAHAGPLTNLVQDPGFENGLTFSPPWNFTAAPSGSDAGITTNPVDANSGIFAWFFDGATNGSYDMVEQTLATTPQNYLVSYFIETQGNPATDSRDLQVFWNGSMIQDLSGAGTGAYVQYSFIEPATGTSTPLLFQGYNVSNEDFVDDVSVVGVPEPGARVLLLCGLGLLSVCLLMKLQRS